MAGVRGCLLLLLWSLFGQAWARLCAYKKVALLFLTMGPMPHERLWTLWLEGAAGLVPLEALREPTCSKERLSHIQSHCTRRGGAGGVLHAQHLFTVYIHPPPGYADYPHGSLFHNRELPDNLRVATQWGHLSQSTAVKVLLRAALHEPRNYKFALLSESCVPLYSAPTTYAILVKEDLSRTDACSFQPDRWAEDYVEGEDAVKIPETLLRRHSQFWALKRKHALLVALEDEVHKRSEKVCSLRSSGHVPPGQDEYCHSSEHYVPTVLAYWGLANETGCVCSTTYADYFVSIMGRPGAFSAENVTADVVRKARCECGNCYPSEAIRLTPQWFGHVDRLSMDLCEAEDPWEQNPLTYYCSLFARKFLPSATDAVVQLYSNCSNDLHVLGCEGESTKRK